MVFSDVPISSFLGSTSSSNDSQESPFLGECNDLVFDYFFLTC